MHGNALFKLHIPSYLKEICPIYSKVYLPSHHHQCFMFYPSIDRENLTLYLLRGTVAKVVTLHCFERCFPCLYIFQVSEVPYVLIEKYLPVDTI